MSDKNCLRNRWCGLCLTLKDCPEPVGPIPGDQVTCTPYSRCGPPESHLVPRAIAPFPQFQPTILKRTWDSDDTRPRSLIYVRKHLQADQLRPFATRDITWVKVKGITFTSVYRPSDLPQEVDNILEAWTPPFQTVIAGDFNAGDVSWDSDNSNYHGGASLAQTMEEHGLDLISQPDVPTHRGGNVLDLVFSDTPLAEAAVNRDLQCTSDHETLRIVVPILSDLD